MQQERIRTCIDTEFKLYGQNMTGKIRNVSEGGAFVNCGALPEGGDNVDLCFTGPGGEQVHVSGVVWWTTADCDGPRTRNAGFGLRLLEENDEYSQFLAKLTSWNPSSHQSAAVSRRRTAGRAGR